MSSLFLHSNSLYVFGLEISLYGIMIALGMIAGIGCAFLICKIKGLDTNMPFNLALFALPLAIIGARIYYCIFHPMPFYQVFRIWEGGMAIYGGVIGGFLGVLIAQKVYKYSFLDCLDVCAPSLILGQAIGRIGCYFGGCCYGIETLEPNLQFFPASVLISGKWHLATFFYESILDLLGFALLMIVTKKSRTKGVVVSTYFITYGLIRAVLESIRDDSESLKLWNSSLRVSQLLSILLVVLGIAMLLVLYCRKRRIESNGI